MATRRRKVHHKKRRTHRRKKGLFGIGSMGNELEDLAGWGVGAVLGQLFRIHVLGRFGHKIKLPEVAQDALPIALGFLISKNFKRVGEGMMVDAGVRSVINFAPKKLFLLTEGHGGNGRHGGHPLMPANYYKHMPQNLPVITPQHTRVANALATAAAAASVAPALIESFQNLFPPSGGGGGGGGEDQPDDTDAMPLSGVLGGDAADELIREAIKNHNMSGVLNGVLGGKEHNSAPAFGPQAEDFEHLGSHNSGTEYGDGL
jgi:hypothetical protein